MIEIKLSAGEPEYLQIAQQVRFAVARGLLKPGDRLSPVRELARELGINPGTVARAYRVLEREGIIETGGRRGSSVAPERDVSLVREMRAGRLRALMEKSVVEALAQGFSPGEIEAAFGAQLSAWRERRYRPEPEVLSTETGNRLVQFAGSHDLALEALWAQARRTHPDVTFSQRYVGSLDGLLALLHGEAGLSGAHLLDEESGEYNLPILRRLFVGQRLRVVTLAEREQGLIVARGNPKHIREFGDLRQPEVRFVNRQPGSGTRTLLDHHLRLLNISHRAVMGYEREVPTHLAVAAAVAEAAADVGLGVLAAAHAFNLDFIPVSYERYDLVLLAEDRMQPPLNWLLDMLSSPAFQAVVAGLGGYHTATSGREIEID